MYSWVFFDADGTLFDFDAAQEAALTRTWTQAGLPPAADLLQRYQRINGDLWERYERGLVSQDEVKLRRFTNLLLELDGGDRRASELADAFVINLSREGRLLDGAADLLKDLNGRCSLVLVTNGIAEVQRGRIARAGIADHFRSIVISAEVGAAKPASEFFDAAFSACGDPDPAEVIIIGDSLSSDVRGGLDYGIATCWFNPEGRQRDEEDPRPDHTVGGYVELRELLGVGNRE